MRRLHALWAVAGAAGLLGGGSHARDGRSWRPGHQVRPDHEARRGNPRRDHADRHPPHRRHGVAHRRTGRQVRRRRPARQGP
ncbi:hypothetical protein ACRJ4W_29780 [Streptomyces sp. GLT-R25]